MIALAARGLGIGSASLPTRASHHDDVPHRPYANLMTTAWPTGGTHRPIDADVLNARQVARKGFES